MEMNNKIRSNLKKDEARKVRTDIRRGSAASQLPGGCFMGGRQAETLPGGGFH